MKDFKIRCSAIGEIMATPRKKTETLSQTAKKYCENWLKEQIFLRHKEIKNKYLDKGQIMEDNAIDFISNYLKYEKPLIKNEHFLFNDFMSGTPDVIDLENKLIIEVKNSWDCFTFPLFENDITNKNYYYQIQGYMHLQKFEKAKLIYVLMDTPEYLIQKEYKYSQENNPFKYEEFREKYLYSNIKNKYRIKTFQVDYDKEVIEKIESKVAQCREYIKQITPK